MHKALALFRTYRYELIAVADGMIVMMLELVGSRYVAPYLGTSTYVWTAIIGVILGALAIGNWYGGRLADRGASLDVLVRIFLVASVLLLLQLFFQVIVLSNIADSSLDLRIQALLAALLLFAPAAVFMGMVSPYLAKLRLTSLEHAGRSVGTLYAAGTAGSIIGTFLAGYWLIGTFGSRTLGWALVAALILVSFAVQRRRHFKLRVSILVVALLLMTGASSTIAQNNFGNARLLYDGDSAYARYQVYGGYVGGNETRYLLMDNEGAQSGVQMSAPSTPIFDYTQRFMEIAAALPSPPQRILMIGGGSFTVPAALAERYPRATIDVIEIDPKLTSIAEQYFLYNSPQSVHIINQDGRYFLNHNSSRYDVIYMDAFSALTPPFQLTTQETSQRLSASLTSTGIVVINLVASPTGPASEFARASFATYRSEFSNVTWYKATPRRALTERQNIIVLASENRAFLRQATSRLDWARIADVTIDKRLVLIDDFAPVEVLTSRH